MLGGRTHGNCGSGELFSTRENQALLVVLRKSSFNHHLSSGTEVLKPKSAPDYMHFQGLFSPLKVDVNRHNQNRKTFPNLSVLNGS